MPAPTDVSPPARNRLTRLNNLRKVALHRAATSERIPVMLRPAGFNGNWTRRQWAHASLFATLGALLAAMVPGFSSAMQEGSGHAQRATLVLALPALPQARQAAQPGHNWQLVTVEAGQTLGDVFEDLDIPASTMHRLLDQPGAKQALTRLMPGDELAFDLALDAYGRTGALRTFRYDRDETHRVELTLRGDKVSERVIERPTETRTTVISGEVGRSLFHSARKLGLSGKAINSLTDEIFKYDIDFNHDVVATDRFSVVVEQVWREGELIKTGPVLAATFTVQGKPHAGFRFERDGKAEYFTADGRPLKRAFIRMPIPYARLTSGFGSRRHPVLGRTRMHKGVDYGASRGTPIMAAGDARVAFVGRKGGYGNAVVLDHGRGYTTLYGHMSRFGKIKRGQRVAQGTVIGYVGATGLATGPHLHYEFRINGVHRNPLSVTMPPPEPLSGKALAAFRAQTGPALARIREVEDIIFAEPETRVAATSKPAANSKG